MPKTRLGALRESVDVERLVELADGQGGASLVWQALATALPAAVVRGGSSESRQAAAVASHVAYAVELVYRPDITAGMRLRWAPYLAATKTLEIIGVGPKDGGAERLALDCVEVAA